MRKTILLIMALALIALVGGAASATAASSKVVMKAKVSGAEGYESIKGKARYEAKTKKNGTVDKRFRVQLQKIKGVAKGTVVDVFLAGVDVADMKVKSHHEAKLDLKSKKGHAVPTPVEGDLLEVKLRDGTVIATGTF